MPMDNAEPSQAAGDVEKKSAELWAKEKNTPNWLFAGTKALHAWPVGKELTAADYDAAISAALDVRIGG